jgi:muconolactone D-isomerase
MEFIVHIEVRWPPDGDPDAWARLAAAEGARARELAAQGIIKRLWRIPGRRANWGLWAAPDATALHAAISSLPLFPWLDVEVHAVGAHPNDPASWMGKEER